MIRVGIICIGKLKERYLRDACAEYIKRMSRWADASVTEIAEERLPEEPSALQIENALSKEGKRILSAVPKGAQCFAMCIEGTQYSSSGFAAEIEKAAVSGCGNIVFIIGSSFGLSDEVKGFCQKRLSMSEMTFPHQLARVMLCEQIYRAFQINSGGKYHK